jgi:oligosaccharide repeat unit polymerase
MISTNTWLIIFSSVISVIVGFYTHYFLKHSGKAKIYIDVNTTDTIYFNETRLEKLLKVLILLVAIGVFGDIIYLSKLIREYSLNPLNIFWYRFVYSSLASGEIEYNFIHSLFNYFMLLNNIAIPLSGIYYVFFRKKKILFLAPLILPFIFGIATLQRFTIISNLTYWIFTIFFTMFFLRNDKMQKVQKDFFKILGVLFIFIFIIIISVISIRINIDTGGLGKKVIKLGIQSVYLYISGNIVALDQYLIGCEDYKNGAILFNSILKWLARFGLYSTQDVPTKRYLFINIGPAVMNTYSYIRILYEDFGIMGLLPFSYIWGILTSVSINSLFDKFSLVKLIIANLFVFSMFISFFTFTLHNLTMIIFLVFFGWIIDRLLNRKI